MEDLKAEKNFSQRIRSLRKSRGMTQKETAARLGLGQSAVANYEQGLRFPDGEILKKISRLFDVSLDYLLGNDVRRNTVGTIESPPAVGDVEDYALRYREMMVNHRCDEGVEMLTEVLKAGVPLDVLYDRVLIPLLRHTGDLWEKGIIDVAREHTISEAVERTAGVLAYLSPRAEPIHARCICASAGPEKHSLSTRMVADLLTVAGWETWFPGVQTPTRDILGLCASTRADLLVLSATLDSHIDAVEGIITSLRSEPYLDSCAILVGGSAFNRNPEAWKAVGADAFAPTITTAVTEAQRLLVLRRNTTS